MLIKGADTLTEVVRPRQVQLKDEGAGMSGGFHGRLFPD